MSDADCRDDEPRVNRFELVITAEAEVIKAADLRQQEEGER